MNAHIIKYCLVYFCVAFSRALRIMTQNESCDIRQLYVVELAVGSCIIFVMHCHLGPVLGLSCLGPVLGPSCRSMCLTIKFSWVYRTLYVSLI